jgi:hypothetical protein
MFMQRRLVPALCQHALSYDTGIGGCVWCDQAFMAVAITKEASGADIGCAIGPAFALRNQVFGCTLKTFRLPNGESVTCGKIAEFFLPHREKAIAATAALTMES